MIGAVRNSLAGFLRMGGQVFGSGGVASAKDRISHGLQIRNFSPETLKTPKDEEATAKKKIAENFESVLAGRLAEADRDGERSAEEREALVDSVMGAIERIRTDFGQEMATETMVEVLKGTEQRMDAATVAAALGKVLRERETLATRILTGKISESDGELVKKHFGDVGEDEELLERVKEDAGKLKEIVEFLNKRDEVSAAAGATSTVNSGSVVNPGAFGGKITHSSVSSALNSYYGEVLMNEEDRHAFTDDFEWARASDVKAKNGEYRSAMYGFDFTMSVSELGRENLDDLVRFLRDEMGDADSAALIENLADADDIFAAVNAVYVANDPGLRNVLAGPLKLNADGSPMLIPDDESFWEEQNRLREADYARLTDPGYEAPEFNYDSDYGYGFMDGTDWKTGDYQWDLARFLTGAILDKVNGVIRDNEKVRERFLEVASKNFGGRADAVPDDYGLVGFPSYSNMGQVSVSYLMGTADTTAAERALQTLKSFSFPDSEGLLKGFRIENRTSVKTVELPGYSELWEAERKNVYEEAISRYEKEKERKGLLLEETA
ncbi:MAG: hypothetical protein LBQ12_04155 [Deltaproteobacteria bacterium]|jgi:hypothetical protein|nr:hypothetical protein [Deltaproteobacteria bacterium]